MARQGADQIAPTKERIGIRLDQDVLEHARAMGRGWNGRINSALRHAFFGEPMPAVPIGEGEEGSTPVRTPTPGLSVRINTKDLGAVVMCRVGSKSGDGKGWSDLGTLVVPADQIDAFKSAFRSARFHQKK